MTRVIGLGQIAAGDDGVGIAVARRLAAGGAGTAEVREAPDAAALVELLLEADRAVVIDALCAAGADPGEIRILSERDLGGDAAPVSSHAMSVPQAIGLARVLGFSGQLRLVGVAVERPEAPRFGLSPAVQAAIPAAIAATLTLLDDEDLEEVRDA